jgi:hypothetical protein
VRQYLRNSILSSSLVVTVGVPLQGGLWFFSKKNNILIPNVAEKHILILMEGKKI